MIPRVRAVYRNGTFVPQRACPLAEGTEVDLIIEEPTVLPPAATDPQERERIIQRLIRRMEANPIPANAPRFTREELHEDFSGYQTIEGLEIVNPFVSAGTP